MMIAEKENSKMQFFFLVHLKMSVVRKLMWEETILKEITLIFNNLLRVQQDYDYNVTVCKEQEYATTVLFLTVPTVNKGDKLHTSGVSYSK